MKRPPSSRGLAAAKRNARRRGAKAEWIAAWLLRLKGYRVLAKNFRVSAGEIDIVARKGAALVAVEVKARATYDAAGHSIMRKQQQRVARAAQHYLAAHPELQDLSLRFDVILVTPKGLPRHITAAWIMV